VRSSRSPAPLPSDTFYGREYIDALRAHHPELFADGESADRALHIGIVGRWIEHFDTVGVDAPDRLQRLPDRTWRSERSAWDASGAVADPRHAGVHYAYKGLIQLKPAIDLVLYSNLIWELRPRTIVEFGSMQGGSALWFADQLDALCGHGEVHSFELCFECISPRASHPRLHFHRADLRDLATLDGELLARLPHPWLVVDDAHENLERLVPFVAGHMAAGDYYVLEDVFLYHPERTSAVHPVFGAEMVARVAAAFDGLGFLVDTKYTDAFGVNVTASPNGWLVKQ
jgi:cephalosporin hydroxylase